jgi:acyl-CoA thioesterase FadM
MIQRTPISVRFYELDPYGHLNHSVYIQYFEVGRIDMFASFGWTLGGLADLGTHRPWWEPVSILRAGPCGSLPR